MVVIINFLSNTNLHNIWSLFIISSRFSLKLNPLLFVFSQMEVHTVWTPDPAFKILFASISNRTHSPFDFFLCLTFVKWGHFPIYKAGEGYHVHTYTFSRFFDFIWLSFRFSSFTCHSLMCEQSPFSESLSSDFSPQRFSNFPLILCRRVIFPSSIFVFGY